MSRWFLIGFIVLVLASVSPSPLRAAQPPVDPSTTENWLPYVLQAGETASCLIGRAQLERAAFATANRLVNPDLLSSGDSIALPAETPDHLTAAGEGDTSLVVAVREALPLWEFLRRNSGPLYSGRTIALPGGDSSGPCLPYPLSGIQLTPQPLTRGSVALLSMEITSPATCEVVYLGQTEPCYRDGEGRLVALVAISALMEPGVYPLRVRLSSRGISSEVVLAMEIAAGRYGFQFIDPPATLSGLMDPVLMQEELDYLAPWRGLRTAERLWDLPLTFPLTVNVPISADYGDRRSYGGLVDGYHSGVDYRAWTGLPVIAPADGIVVMAETLEARGNAVLIDHGWGLITGYWHLSRIDVEVGQRVERGEAFAAVGSTGLSTGAHLHWELWASGISVDAKQWLYPQGLPGWSAPVGAAAGAQ